MKKSEVVYLSAFVMIAPHVQEDISLISSAIMTLCAVAFDWFESK